MVAMIFVRLNSDIGTRGALFVASITCIVEACG